LKAGDLGDVFAVDLVFHNAYGPDKAWFLDRRLAGGGCVIDLATHLVDLLPWLLGGGELAVTSATVLVQGRSLPVTADAHRVEDFAIAELMTADGAPVRLACSWFLHAGRDCVFECTLHGTEAAASITNVDGSFYDFRLSRCAGTATEVLVAPPDDWGVRALRDWADRLGRGEGFDAAAAAELLATARTIDAVYAAAGVPR
jgi:predicted dehydrogenase